MKPWTSSRSFSSCHRCHGPKHGRTAKARSQAHAAGLGRAADRSQHPRNAAGDRGRKVRPWRGDPCHERALDPTRRPDRRFQASVGVDDAAGGPGTVVFHVVGDGKELWTSGVMKPNEKAKTIDLDLRGVKRLLLLVDDAGDGINFDHADWANARFTFHGRARRPSIRPNRRQKRPCCSRRRPAPRRRSTGPRSMPAAQNIRSSIAFPPRASGRCSSPPKDFPPASRSMPMRASSAARLPRKANTA